MIWRWLFASLLLAGSSALAATEAPAPSPTAATPPQFHDIRGPLPANSLPPFLLTAGVLLLVGGLFLVVRRARHPSPSRPPTPTAHDPDAVDPLATLVDDYRRGICPGDQLIIRLDALVRDTLAARSGIPARSLTSVELRQALSHGTAYRLPFGLSPSKPLRSTQSGSFDSSGRTAQSTGSGRTVQSYESRGVRFRSG